MQYANKNSANGYPIWLASYPKSGNTWVRLFLSSLLGESTEGLDINKIPVGTVASARDLLENALGIDISEFSQEEIEVLRPIAYQALAQQLSDGNHEAYTNIFKVHDTYTTANGLVLFPPEITAAAVILVRNPLDVAISFANHSNITISKSVNNLCRPKLALCNNPIRFDQQVKQRLSSWNTHVGSWMTADVPKLVIRYEDLHRDAFRYFSKLTDFLQLDKSHHQVQQAIDSCEFKKLKQKENEGGFREKAPKVKNFFRSGSIGDWQQILDESMIAKIIEHNAPYMRKLGYLNAQGRPLVEPLEINPNEL